MTTVHDQTKRLAILFAAGFAVVNVAFYVLSGSYFETHHQVVNGASVPLYSPEQASHLRIVFALVSGAVAAVGFLAGLRRRLVGHVLAAVLGAVNLAGGIAALVQHGPAALIATLAITGAAMPVLAWQSYHRVRAAWAFLVALCGVLAVVGLFGAPMIRGVLDVSLWTTMLLPGMLAVACFTLILLRDDYVDRTPTT